MDALPTESLDLIMHQVEKLDLYGNHYPLLRLYPSKFTTFENPRLAGLKTSDGYRVLATLRLISKAICFSASSVFFRNVRFKITGLKNWTGFTSISNSRWAKHVRKGDIVISSGFIHGINGLNRLSQTYYDFFSCLQLLFLKFANLEAFGFYSKPYNVEFEAFINMVVNTIRSMPPRKLTELDISHHYWGDFDAYGSLLPITTSPEPSKGELANLKHLGLKGDVICGKGSELEILNLIHSAVNLESLRLENFKSENVSRALRFINAHRLRYLELDGGCFFVNELFNLLKQCKNSIRYIEISITQLRDGSWLELLFQVSRGLKLLKFECTTAPYGSPGHFDLLRRGLEVDRRDENILCMHIQNDIVRQVNANRYAAGLLPFKGELELPPLKSVMEEEHYQELCSLPEL